MEEKQEEVREENKGGVDGEKGEGGRKGERENRGGKGREEAQREEKNGMWEKKG